MHDDAGRGVWARVLMAAAAMAFAPPALAHHVMGGAMPVTAVQGLLSGLGHPILGIDHLAAVIAVGMLAARRDYGIVLAVSFVLAMIAGAAAHVAGTNVPAAEIFVAASLLALGVAILALADIGFPAAFALFVGVGLIHGYALGESIAGAEVAPLYAYFVGLAIIQSIIALGALAAARWLTARAHSPVPLRLAGAAIIGVGLIALIADAARAAAG